MNFAIPLAQYQLVENYGKQQSCLLFSSLPIAGPILPAEYAHHYSLQVYALHILLGFSTLPRDLNIANDLLLCFYQHMPELYEDTSYLINVHNLIHLVPLVKQWGPFGFTRVLDSRAWSS